MMPRLRPKTIKKWKPQITLITLIFFIICVNLCNLWTTFTAENVNIYKN